MVEKDMLYFTHVFCFMALGAYADRPLPPSATETLLLILD
jgi:hypothetical protein